MNKIHSTAIVDSQAEIGQDVEIGPYSIVEGNVKLGNGVKIAPHCHIMRFTDIGEGSQIFTGVCLGNTPQDLAFKDRVSYLKIGSNNIIREQVTIHRGTEEGSSTVVGNKNYLMAGCHLGHNCQIGNNVIIANGALLAGRVTVEDFAFISGNVVVHQYCRIGKLAIIGGFSGVNKDVPPFMSVRGPSVVWSINLVGLRRAKISRDSLRQIKDAYSVLYLTGLNTAQAIDKIIQNDPCQEVMYLIDFIKSSKRGICKYKFEGKDSGYFESSEDEEKDDN